MTVEQKTKECLGKCPYCDSDNISYDTTEILDNTLRYPAVCLDCEGDFNEDYVIEYAETQYCVTID